MTAFTTTQVRAASMSPGATDKPGMPGNVVIGFTIDGSKLTVAATDTVDFFDLPAYAGMIVHAAAVTVVKPGTATGTLGIQLGGADVTGLTAWATDAAAGTELIKLASAANTVVNTSSASAVRFQQNTAGLGTGVLHIRVWATLLEAPPV